MEEKILFDIQLFADTEVISAGQSATIDGITYTATNGTVTISGNTISGDAEISGTVTNHTFNLNKATISVNGMKISSKTEGTVTVNSNAITLSGNISSATGLNEKTVTTLGNDTVNLLLAESDTLTIDGTTYKAEDAAVVSVTDKKVTSNSGTLTVTPKNSVTLNDVSYTAENNSSTIKLDEGDATLSGKFTLKTDLENFVKINKINVKGDSFTFDSADKNFAGDFEIKSSYGRNFKVNGIDLTVDGETATAEVTSSLTKLTGSYTVGDGTTSLTGKSFEVSAGEISFQTLKNDSVKINDATFGGKENFKLTAYFADNNVIKVDGADITINGNGKFILVDNSKAATINDIDFKGNTTYAQVDYLADGVKLNGAFTIGDGSQNIGNLKISAQSDIKGSTFKLGNSNDTITIGGATYTGDGEISVDSDDEKSVTLSGSLSVDALSGRSYTVKKNNSAVFNLNAEDSITINGKSYTADADHASITVYSDGSITPDNVTGSGDEAQTFNLNSSASKTVTYAGVTYTATENDAKVTVEEKKVTVTGDVKIDFTNEEEIVDYDFSIAQNKTAQINGVSFTQTGNSSQSNDIHFDSANEITLNAPFTIGDGTQALTGLSFNLNVDGETQFNFGSTLKETAGTSGDVTYSNDIRINYVEFSGDSGTVTITKSGGGDTYTVGLSGGAISVSGTLTAITSFTLSDSNTYTINDGAFQIDNSGADYTLTMSGGTVSSISGIKAGASITSLGNLNSFTATIAGTYTINNTQFITLTDGVEFTLVGDGVKVGNITYKGTSAVTVNTNGITVDGIPYTGSGTVDSDGTVTDSVQGTFTLSSTAKTFNGISYSGTGTATITSSGVTVDGVTFTSDTSATHTVKLNSSNNFTVTGVSFTIINGKTVNGITYNGNSATASASSTDSLTIDNVIYSGTGSINSDGTIGEGISLKISAGGNALINGITYTNNTTNELTAKVVSGGTEFNGLTYSGTGTVNTGGTVTGNMTISGASNTSINGYTVTGSIGISGGAITTLNSGATIAKNSYSYTADGNATISVDANGKVTVLSGTVKQTAGTFSLNGVDGFTVDSGGATWTGANLTAGGGTKSLNAGDVYSDYTALTGTSLKAVGSDTSYITLNGDFTTTSSDAYTFTHNGKSYTTSGTVTYKVTGNGSTKIDSLQKSLYTATATSVVSGTKIYGGNTYTVDEGSKYTYTISNGGTPTENLSASATFTASDTQTFSYNSKTYKAGTGGVELKISYNGETDNDISWTSKTGTATRDYTSNTVTYDGNIYNLTGTHTLDLSNDSETLVATGTFTASLNQTFSYNYNNQGAKTYTAEKVTNFSISYNGASKESLTADDTFTLTSATGSGTRDKIANDTVTKSGLTYTLSDGAKVLLTLNGTPTETFYSGSATYTYAENATLNYNGKDYTAGEGGVTLTLTRTLNANDTVAITSGTATRTEDTFTYDNKPTYSGTSTFTLNSNLDGETWTSAHGTRAYDKTVDNNNQDVTFDGNTYIINGTYTIDIANDNKTSEILDATGTCNVTNSAFHYADQDYNGNASLTISYDGTNTTLTSATGSGTRTVTAESETLATAYSHDGNNYTTALTGSVITGTIDGTNLSKQTVSEEFTSGTATKSLVDNETFHYKGNNYNAEGAATLTYTTNDGNVALTGTGTRLETTNKNFTFDNKSYTADNNGITYKISKGESAERVYAATATRDVDTNGEAYTATSGNSYTLNTGTYKIVIDNYAQSSGKFIDGTAEKVFDSDFKYNNTSYTPNTAPTLKVTINENGDTEEFVSGSASDSSGNFIIKSDSASIGNVTYTNSADRIVTLSQTDGSITGISNGSLTATFNNTSATIGGVTYDGTGNLTFSNVNDITVSSGGNFTVTGLSSSNKLNNTVIVGNATVTVTNGVISTVQTTGDGTFTIGDETFTISGDNGGVTFNFTDGALTSISGIERSGTDYVTINTGEKNYYIRRNGDTLTKTNGTWAEPSLTINSYAVTYNGDFSVTATYSDNQTATLTTTDVDYTLSDGDKTISLKDTSKPITVSNSTNDAIKVGGVAGIGNVAGTISIANNSANSFTAGGKTYTITGGTFKVDGSNNISLVGDATFTVNGTSITTSGATTNTLITDASANVTGISSASGNITVPTPNNSLTFTIGGTNISVTNDNDSSGVTFMANGASLTALTDVSTAATVVLTGTMPASLSINGQSVINDLAANTNIKYNTTDSLWTSGNAPAATDVTNYEISIDSANKVILKYSKDGSNYTTTTNVNDFTTVFGNALGMTADGDTAQYTSGINIASAVTSKVGKISITPSGNKAYSVNGQTFTISSATTLNPVDANSINVQLGNVTYKEMQLGGTSQATLNGDTITLANGAKVTDTKATVTFNVTGTVDFDNITVTNAANTNITNVDTATTKLTIGGNDLQVKGDNIYTVDVSANKISQIGGNVIISGTFANTSTISTDNANKFKIGSSPEFTLGNDKAVNITVSGGTVQNIGNLNDSLTGDFTTSVKINGQDVYVTDDNTIGVIGNDSGVTELNKLTGGITVIKAGGATKLSTDSTGNFTFGSQKFSIDGESSVDFTKDSAAATVKGVSNFENGSITAYQNESAGFSINDAEAITFEGVYSNNPLTMAIVASAVSTVDNLRGNITKIPANALVGVKTVSQISINNKALQTSDTDITVKAASGGYDSVGGLTAGAVVTTAENVPILTDGAGNYTFGTTDAHKFYTDDNSVTFKTGASTNVTEINNIDNARQVVLYQGETGLKIDTDNITIDSASDTEPVTLKVADNHVSEVYNLKSNIKTLQANTKVEVTTDQSININDKAIQITGDADGNFTVNAANGGYDTVTGITAPDGESAVNFNTAENVKLVTDKQGNFIFNQNGTFTAADNDNNIVFTTGANSSLTAIDSLSGTVKGSFVNEVTVDGKSIYIGGDSEVSVVAESNSVKSIHQIFDGATVYKAADVSLLTDGNGTFTFSPGDNINHKFKVKGDSDGVTFVTDSNSKATVIDKLASSAQILVSQEETVKLNNADITIKGATDANPLTLTMSGNNTVNSVSDLKDYYEIDGLSQGAVITVTGENVTINGTELQIKESGRTDFVAYSRANYGYVSITGVNNGATITSAKNTSVVADATGTYTFKNGEDVHKFEITDNNRAVTLKTDENGKVTAIDGLDVDAKLVLSQGETITINNREKVFELADVAAYKDSPVTLTMGSGNTLKSIDNLKGNIGGLSNDALVTVTTNQPITIDSRFLKVDEGANTSYVVDVNRDGYKKITGISNGAKVASDEGATIVTDEEGSFTLQNGDYDVMGQYTITGDTDVTINTERGGNVLSINGLENGTLQANVRNEVNVTLNGTALYSNDTGVSIVTADSAITSIIGLGDGGELMMPASTYVSVKGYNNIYNPVNVTINADTFDIAGDIDGIVISEGGKVITGLNGDARLTVSATGDFTVNGTALTIDNTLDGSLDGSLRVFIGENVNSSIAASARLYQEGEISFGDYTPAEDIAKEIMSNIDSDIDLRNATVPVEGTSANASGNNQVVIVSETITGDTITVNLSGNSDLAIIRRNDVNITASVTGDTVISSGTDVKVDVGSATSAVIMPTGGTLTIENYDANKASIQLTNSDVAAAVRDKTLKFTEDNIQVGNATVNVEKVDGASGYISFISSTGDEQKVAYAGNNESETNEYSFNASDYEGKEGDSKGVVIIGKEGSKNKITGSSKNDSAFGGTGDYFDMGKGDNYVEISTVRGGTGASSIIAESGNTTVKGFKFEDSFGSSDIAKFSEISSDTTATFDGKNVIITNGDKATLTLEVDGTKEVVNVNITDGTKENDELKIVKTAIVKDGADITVASATNANDFADAYVGGKNSGVDLTKFSAEATVNVDLSEGTGKFGTSDVTFRDIARVKGSDDEHSIKGAAGKSNTIEAGKGSATIWGYGEKSDDLLIGNSEQTKSSTFIFDGEDGNDTIEGFQFYKFTLGGGSGSEVTNEPTPTNANASVNSAKADVLFLKEEHWQTLEDIVIKDDNVVIQMTDSEDNSITIKDAKDTAFLYKFQRAGVADGSNIESWVTKVSDNKITYDGVTQFYKTTSKNATLEVSADYLNNDSSYSDSSIIYLNGKVNGLGKQETLEGIDSRYPIVGLDASSVTAAVTLVGNSANNVIKIGSVGGGLWGTEYSFGNDLLIGGAGSDTFVYGTGEGDDTVQNFGNGDVIYIHNKTLKNWKEELAKNNIKVTNPDTKTVKIQFSSGSITVVKDSEYSGNVKFKLKDNDTIYDGIEAVTVAANALGNSGDLAEDWGDNLNYETPIDSEPVFWNGESADLSTDEVNNISELYRETSIGEIQFSITGAESFVDEIKSTAKK